MRVFSVRASLFFSLLVGIFLTCASLAAAQQTTIDPAANQ